jgi:hypothetical protein
MLDSPAGEGCEGDQRPADRAADDRRPELAPRRAMRDVRDDRECEPRDRGDEEARAEKEVEPAAFDREASRAQERNEPTGEHENRCEDELQLGQRVRMTEARERHEQGERRPQQAEEHDLPPEEGLKAVGVHLRQYRHNLMSA